MRSLFVSYVKIISASGSRTRKGAERAATISSYLRFIPSTSLKTTSKQDFLLRIPTKGDYLTRTRYPDEIFMKTSLKDEQKAFHYAISFR